MKPYLSVADIARATGAKARLITRHCEAGVLKSLRLKRQRQIDYQSARAWAATYGLPWTIEEVNMSECLTFFGMAKLLKISKCMVKQAHARGEFTAQERRPGEAYLVPIDEVKRWAIAKGLMMAEILDAGEERHREALRVAGWLEDEKGEEE